MEDNIALGVELRGIYMVAVCFLLFRLMMLDSFSSLVDRQT